MARFAGHGYRWSTGAQIDIVGRQSVYLHCRVQSRRSVTGRATAHGKSGNDIGIAIIVFLAVPAFGIASQGIKGYVLEYFRPNPLLFPLHLVSELSRTLALSFRLFGNIMSGHLLVALLISLSGFLVPMPFIALDMLIGLLQAYIFAVLSTVFVGAAIGEEKITGEPA